MKLSAGCSSVVSVNALAWALWGQQGHMLASVSDIPGLLLFPASLLAPQGVGEVAEVPPGEPSSAHSQGHALPPCLRVFSPSCFSPPALLYIPSPRRWHFSMFLIQFLGLTYSYMSPRPLCSSRSIWSPRGESSPCFWWAWYLGQVTDDPESEGFFFFFLIDHTAFISLMGLLLFSH